MFVKVTNTDTLLYNPHIFVEVGTLWNSKIKLRLAPVTTLRQHSSAPDGTVRSATGCTPPKLAGNSVLNEAPYRYVARSTRM